MGNELLLCLRVECLEQFALLQFVQSSACMSLRDPAGLQPETHVRRGQPGVVAAGLKEDVRVKPRMRSGSASYGGRCARDHSTKLLSEQKTGFVSSDVRVRWRGGEFYCHPRPQD